MSDEIPQDLARRAVDVCRTTAETIPLGTPIVEECKAIVRDLDALSAPKDPAEVGVTTYYDCSSATECVGKWTNVREHLAAHIRAAYADHFKQDAEREQASKALSDAVRKEFLKRGIATTIQDANHLIRRLYGWDREP